MATADPRARLPKSVTHFGLNCIALAIVLLAMYALRAHWINVPNPVLLLCGAVAVPIVLLDVFVLKVHRRSSTGLDWDKEFAPNVERVVLKVIGLVTTLVPFAVAYWVFPEYNGTFYTPYYELLGRFWPGLCASSILYIAVVDGHMKEPRDTYWLLGRMMTGKWRDAQGQGQKIGNHYLGWLVKAFFFPLMFVWLNNSTHNVVNYDLTGASWENTRAYYFLYDFIFFIDLLFTAVGYALCFRPIDTHLRSAEPTMIGWAVAIFCYEPFFSMLFEKQYVRYGGIGFDSWLSGHPHLRWVWAGGIVALIGIYALATVAFGVRFSNLTHRGVLTNGPFRFTKHPAYVTKNLSWWMASTPFLVATTEHWSVAIKHCLMLLVVNFMYFWRAKTEERHLSRDPAYVSYALWMNDHGALRWLGRIPVLKHVFLYKAPTAAPHGWWTTWLPTMTAEETQPDGVVPEPAAAATPESASPEAA